MTSRLIEGASSLLARHTDRRGFLRRAAIAGSAVTVAKADYLLKPVSAYAAVCGCSGQTCDCASACCDGYTEFCCTIYGANRCPPGSIMAGWWKADGSGFCDVGGAPQPRYYMDCNAQCGSCGCGASGVCGHDCPAVTCSCGCANGSCGNRKACCTRFRYGQCNQAVACVGPIICRVISCRPPWEFDPTCTTAVATDNNTRFHDAACLHQVRALVGVAVWREPTWYFRRAQSSGTADVVVTYGQAGDVPLLGDWDGDGVKTPGVRRGNTFYLRNSLTPGKADIVFSWGRATDVPLVGDWNGDGRDGVGLRRGNTWYLKDGLDAGPHTREFAWGRATDVPLVGDWNGDGRDGVGLRRGDTWYLKDGLDAGPHSIEFAWGRATDAPVVGDWNGDGRDGVGLVRNSTTWYLKNRLDASPHEKELVYGQAGDVHFGWPYGQEEV